MQSQKLCLRYAIKTVSETHKYTCSNVLFRGIISPATVDDLSTPPIRKGLRFGNAQTFKNKRLSEIVRALIVFKLCSYNVVVRNSFKIMNVSKTILGTRLYNKCMKLTMYGQFVAGETIDELQQTTKTLQDYGLGPMLCLPIEEDAGHELSHDEKYAKQLDMIMACIKLAKHVDRKYPMAQTKLTSLVPGQICSKLSILVPGPNYDPELIAKFVDALGGNQLHVSGMNEADNEELNKSLSRLRQLGKCAEENEVRLLIDAEYTYLNPALRLISLAMMLQFNKKKPIVSYTYQNYLKETFTNLTNDINFVRCNGACFAAKLVRGAYLDQERNLALKHGYEDPVHETFAGTSDMYHCSLKHILDKIHQEPDKYYVIIASHNEDTAQLAMEELERRDLANGKGSVFFGQLYGMSDYLSTFLANAGYLVYKSIPYGPIDETIPYLTRRALENSSILSGTTKERKLLWKALVGRITFRNN
ncbi:Hydroxyproline dehydrogenase [Mactra antiquata]